MMRIGIDVRTIDPVQGALLGGYPDVTRPTRGVNDRLELSTVYIESATSRPLLLIAFDGIVTPPTLRTAAAGIAPESTAVVVVTSHTHSAPSLSVPNWDQGVIGVRDANYEAVLTETVRASVRTAIRSTRRGHVRTGRATLAGAVGSNRRHPGRPGDPVVRTILFENEVSTHTWVIHGCHPTVLGPENLYATADLGLGLRRGLQERNYPGTSQLLMGGAGDQSTRLTRRSSSFDEATRLGAYLADAAERAFKSSEPADGAAAAEGRIHLPTRHLADAATAEADLAALENEFASAQREGVDSAVLRTLEVRLLGLRHDLRRARMWDQGMPSSLLEITAVQLGRQRVLFAPVEPFLSVATTLEADQDAWLVGYANDYRGYLLTDEEIDLGGYELAASPFAHGAVDVLLSEGRRLFETIPD